MNAVIEALFIFFSIITLYMAFLFMFIYLDNRRRFGALPSATLPSVSIIVPAYNEERNIGGTIRALKRLDYPANLKEIIVVDDGSTDSTCRIAKGFKGIRVLRQKNRGKGSALNLGLKHARGDIVGCVDADTSPMHDALRKAVPFFSDESVAGVTGAIIVRNAAGLLGKLQWLEYVMIVWARKLFEFIESVYVTPGPFSLYRKDVLRKLGGFDEHIMTEDIEIAWRLLGRGYRIRMAKDARVLTRVPENAADWWMQRLRWNIGGLQTVLKYKYTFLKDHYGTLGNVVAPFFLTSYVVSILGFALFSYLVGSWLWQNLFFATGAYAIGVDPLAHYELLVVPDIFTFFGLLTFLISIAWVNLGLYMIGERSPPGSRLRNFVDMLVYLTLYITVFPLNLVYSMLKYLSGKYHW